MLARLAAGSPFSQRRRSRLTTSASFIYRHTGRETLARRLIWGRLYPVALLRPASQASESPGLTRHLGRIIDGVRITLSSTPLSGARSVGVGPGQLASPLRLKSELATASLLVFAPSSPLGIAPVLSSEAAPSSPPLGVAPVSSLPQPSWLRVARRQPSDLRSRYLPQGLRPLWCYPWSRRAAGRMHPHTARSQSRRPEQPERHRGSRRGYRTGLHWRRLRSRRGYRPMAFTALSPAGASQLPAPQCGVGYRKPHIRCVDLVTRPPTRKPGPRRGPGPLPAYARRHHLGDSVR